MPSVPDFAIIVAMTKDRVIGREGGLPWRLSADLRRFKQLTMGHAIVMGRRTFESIGRVLPGRTSIVITRQSNYGVPDGVHVAKDFEEGLAAASTSQKIFVIGGGEVYTTALPRASRLYITWVEADVAGDAYFPEWGEASWQLVHEESGQADQNNQFPYRFCEYRRR